MQSQMCLSEENELVYLIFIVLPPGIFPVSDPEHSNSNWLPFPHLLVISNPPKSDVIRLNVQITIQRRLTHRHEI